MEKQWHIENPLGCPIVSTLNMISGKWKPMILHMLSAGTMRFGEIKKSIPPISQKMLTQQLRELESDGIILRKVYPEAPPRVEYSLSDQGAMLRPILEDLYKWGRNYASPSAQGTDLATQ